MNAVHPGVIATGIWAKASKWVQPFFWIAKRLMLTPTKGAQPLVMLASSADVDGKTGLYFDKLKPKAPSKLALDDALGETLWAESARLVKL